MELGRRAEAGSGPLACCHLVAASGKARRQAQGGQQGGSQSWRRPPSASINTACPFRHDFCHSDTRLSLGAWSTCCLCHPHCTVLGLVFLENREPAWEKTEPWHQAVHRLWFPKASKKNSGVGGNAAQLLASQYESPQIKIHNFSTCAAEVSTKSTHFQSTRQAQHGLAGQVQVMFLAVPFSV